MVRNAAERLVTELNQENIMAEGVFRGVTRESGYFDLNTDFGTLTGTVGDNLTEEDLERLHSLTHKQCEAYLQRTTVRKIVGSSTPTYVLLDAKAIEVAGSISNK